MVRVGIVDLGLGNVKSVQKMFLKLGCVASLVREPSENSDFDVIVLPGVGSFTYGATRLRETGWDTEIQRAARGGLRILGICLGMQLLCDRSDEGSGEGLGLIPGSFRRIESEAMPVKVPQMGWNRLSIRNDAPTWIADPDPQARYYFVHSYRYSHESWRHVVATCEYGGATAAIVSHGLVTGIQFHPEKSHRFGFGLLQRFINYNNDR